jgi:very-short-patch-repair endonuclease
MDELYNKNGNIKKNAWKNKDNHTKYAILLGNILGYTKPEHWYNITHKHIKNNKGSGLLMSYYKDSPILFVLSVVKLIYPEYEWLEWKFNKTRQYFWDDTENQKIYMNWLFNKLKYEKIEDWYNIDVDIMRKNDGGSLLKQHSSSHINILKSLYPEYQWLEWKFKYTSNNYWKDIDNQKKYIVWLIKKLKYTDKEEWYNITSKIIDDNDGQSMLNEYNGSPIQLLNALYPEYKWLDWKFKHTSNNYWKNIKNQKEYAKWLGKELGYTTNEDWYNISGEIIKNNHGGGLLAIYYKDSPIQFIVSIFPDYSWDKNKFCKNKTETKIYNIIKNKFPTIITQYKQDWCKRIFHLPFDFCIPEYKIIIELDGRQHFKQVSNWSSPEEQFKNDKYKEKCANDNGYLIIRILQEDVLGDIYNWEEELFESIEKIKNGNTKNIYLCKNEEYSNFI